MHRRSTSGENVSRLFLANAEIDVTKWLGSVTVPTLVLHHPENVRIPLSQAQSLAAEIPNASLVPINVYTPEEFVEFAIDSIVSFLDKHDGLVLSRGRHGAFRTVLFTDLVGHTEMMSRLGDERGRDVLREHERITREVLKAHVGTEVKTMGDGFMASFGSVTRAVECAVALQKAMEARNRGVGAQHTGEADDVRPSADPTRSEVNQESARAAPLQVRIGLNAGEPIEEEGDLFGATVILASRIAGKAEGGEILVADTVRGLCSGKGFLFADRGEFVAKGFEEPVRVYEVRWR